ncbi:transposase [Pseudarthrobacter sp. P1]|uniref:transposase n=1 Tax=Pseudarthrobacter sp. P1 TaxID=3418418 RepID=UPI003CEFFA81
MRYPGKGRPEGQPETQGLRRGRPVRYDRDAYKRRNVVERSFNTLKQWRSLATRYDKLALTYRSAAVLHAVVIWSAALGDTP